MGNGPWPGGRNNVVRISTLAAAERMSSCSMREGGSDAERLADVCARPSWTATKLMESKNTHAAGTPKRIARGGAQRDSLEVGGCGLMPAMLTPRVILAFSGRPSFNDGLGSGRGYLRW